jgi:hypothetical protein
MNLLLKVPKCEIFNHLDIHDFYTIKPNWLGNFGNNLKVLMLMLSYLMCMLSARMSSLLVCSVHT